MQPKRLLIFAGGAAAIVVLFLLLRPGDNDADEAAEPTTTQAKTTATAGTATTSPPPSPASAATEPPAPPPQPAPKPQVAVIRITIRGGKAVGGIERAKVKKGRQVRFVVRSDVVEEVHLHGYDLFRDVAPGKPAQIQFRATIPGGFEVELEDRDLQIAELEVRP